MKHVLVCIVLFTFLGLPPWPVVAQIPIDLDIEAAPFHYSETQGDNRVSRLMQRLGNKEIKLKYTRDRGYLESLLEALEIPSSSQTLVFSKTSMQVRYISRRNPRAIYFNDDTYVGWVNGSSLMEVSTVDPQLGAAFYTVDMAPWRAKFEQATYDCLACHATSMTQGIPGHTVRSVVPSYDGRVDSQLESFITNDRSPFMQRWGGWYVTGMHGQMRHMGNAYLRGGMLDTRKNGNRTHLRDEFDTSPYLSANSDIVALMVLEHQTQMHNTMTRANFCVRKWKHDTQSQDLSDDPEQAANLTQIAREVTDRLLFCGENRLTEEVRGSVLFQNDFLKRGPRDSQQRSLREFDLKTRMFKYPCSYLIHSEAFMSLAPPLRDEIVRQVKEVLEGTDQSESYAHLSAGDRSAVLEILRETHPDF